MMGFNIDSLTSLNYSSVSNVTKSFSRDKCVFMSSIFFLLFFFSRSIQESPHFFHTCPFRIRFTTPNLEFCTISTSTTFMPSTGKREYIFFLFGQGVIYAVKKNKRTRDTGSKGFAMDKHK